MPKNLSNVTIKYIQDLMLEIMNNKDSDGNHFIKTSRLDGICGLSNKYSKKDSLYKARGRFIEKLRDLQSADLVYDDGDKRYVLRNSPSFVFNMNLALKISPEMLAAFSAGNMFVQKFLPHLSKAASEFQSELGKVFDDSLFEEGRSLASSVTMSMPIARTDGQIFSLLQRAIREGRNVSFDYKSVNSGCEIKRQEAYSPWQLFFAEKSWYLWGSIKGREQGMTCKLCRITNLSIDNLGSYVHPTEEQSPEKVLQSVWSARPGVPKHDVKLDIKQPIAETILETDWPEDVTLDKTKDGVILSTKVPDLTGMAFFVLGFAPHVKVLEPEKLREKIDEINEIQVFPNKGIEEVFRILNKYFPHNRMSYTDGLSQTFYYGDDDYDNYLDWFEFQPDV